MAKPEPPGALPYRPCVGVAVFNRDGRVWIGRRADVTQPVEGPGQWWQMPQGGIDPGEGAKTAALRELYEETGIRSVELLAEAPEWLAYDFPPELQRGRLKGYRGQKQRWFAFRLTGPESEIDIAHPGGAAHPEFSEWRWEQLDRLPDLIVPFKRDVYREVVRIFGRFSRPRS